MATEGGMSAASGKPAGDRDENKIRGYRSTSTKTNKPLSLHRERWWHPRFRSRRRLGEYPDDPVRRMMRTKVADMTVVTDEGSLLVIYIA